MHGPELPTTTATYVEGTTASHGFAACYGDSGFQQNQLNGQHAETGFVPVLTNAIPVNNNEFVHELGYNDNSHLLSIATSQNFQHHFQPNDMDSERFVATERLVISEQNHQQPQNAAAAVAAASFLLAANAYDNMLIQSQPQMVLPSMGLENIPNCYGFGYNHQQRQFVSDCDNVGQYQPPPPTSTILAKSSNDDSCSNESTNFLSQQPLSISAADNLMMDESGTVSCSLTNNNIPNFDCLQSQQQSQQQTSGSVQSVQDLKQLQHLAVTHQLSTEKIEVGASCVQCAVCDEQIHDRYMLAVNQCFYHMTCLRCSACATPMNDFSVCYSKHQAAYCKPCYAQKFQTKCAHCDRAIQPTDWVRRARAHVYHLACFSCNHCKRQLSTGEQFSLQESKLLCKQHYLELVQGEDAQHKSKTKRVRTTFADEQLSILQAHFQMDCNPDGADLERIANQTGLSKRVTQVWFQNSRARQKKYQVGGKKASSTVSTDRQSDTAPLGSSNSGRSSPTTTIDSSMSPSLTKSPSIERHTLLPTNSDQLMSTASTIELNNGEYVTNVGL